MDRVWPPITFYLRTVRPSVLSFCSLGTPEIIEGVPLIFFFLLFRSGNWGSNFSFICQPNDKTSQRLINISRFFSVKSVLLTSYLSKTVTSTDPSMFVFGRINNIPRRVTFCSEPEYLFFPIVLCHPSFDDLTLIQSSQFSLRRPESRWEPEDHLRKVLEERSAQYRNLTCRSPP